MRLHVLALLLALALAAPAQAVRPLPDPSTLDELLVREEADGSRTLVLAIEDGEGGEFAYAPASEGADPETGTYRHAWTREGAPMLTVGVYARSSDAGFVRAPVVIFENFAGDAAAAQRLALDYAVNDTGDTALNVLPFLLEYAAPTLGPSLDDYGSDATLGSYRDQPAVYAWLAKRTGPLGEAWIGLGVEREGSTGGSTLAEKTTSVGVALRDRDGTRLVAGLYVANRLSVGATETSEGAAQSAADEIEVGAFAPLVGQVPLATLRADDARMGEWQETTLSAGYASSSGYVPLVGTRSRLTGYASERGVDTTQVVSAGAFVDGAYVPLVGARYHSDTGGLPEVMLALARTGPGGDAGNFEIEVGTFVESEFLPVAAVRHRDFFPGAHFARQTMVAVGAHGPQGFVPVAVVTYDGTRAFTPWALDWYRGLDEGDAWRIATGTAPDGNYVPLLGVEYEAVAPAGTREVQFETRTGVFAGSYDAFVPLASASYDGDVSLVGAALRFATGGLLGAETGDFEATLGAYSPDGAYVPLAGVGVRDDFDSGGAETLLVVGAYDPDGAFVPVVGVAYDGEAPFESALGEPGNVSDDLPSRVRAGAFVGGAFVPLVTVTNDGEGVGVLVGPDLGDA